jgi:hypothetical protein
MLKLESLNACRLQLNGSLICFAHWKNFINEQQVAIANTHNAHGWSDFGNWDLALVVLLQSLLVEYKVHQDFGFMKLLQDLFKL